MYVIVNVSKYDGHLCYVKLCKFIVYALHQFNTVSVILMNLKK